MSELFLRLAGGAVALGAGLAVLWYSMGVKNGLKGIAENPTLMAQGYWAHHAVMEAVRAFVALVICLIALAVAFR